MKKLNGYEQAEVIKEGSGKSNLQKGAYQMVVKGAYLKEGSKGSYIEMDIDVSDGEYKNFYEELYKAQSGDNKKWRGKYFLSVPEECGTPSDMYKLRLFKTFINHIEDSNPGFKWNWKESELAGKRFGGLVVNNEYRGRDGNIRTGTVLARTCSIQDVIDNTFKMPKDRLISEPGNNGFVAVEPADGIELPFK